MSDKKLIDMTNEEYDKFMCNKFPELFKDRCKPMNETCMCWGFNIGEGWHDLLNDLCEKLELIRKETGLVTVFDQIKEKYGGGRFYYHIDMEDCKIKDEVMIVRLWEELIRGLVSGAENCSDETCATCSKRYFYGHITINGWVYDSCKKCIISGKREVASIKDLQNLSESIECIEERKERRRQLNVKIEYMTDKQLTNMEKAIALILPKE